MLLCVNSLYKFPKVKLRRIKEKIHLLMNNVVNIKCVEVDLN